jgi:hypothetical protein
MPAFAPADKPVSVGGTTVAAVVLAGMMEPGVELLVAAEPVLEVVVVVDCGF